MPPGIGDVAAALVRLADAADRAVFLAEVVAVHMGLVDGDSVGVDIPEEEEDGAG